MECVSDVQVLQVHCVSLHSGVLLGSVCSGLLLGIMAAVLIHTFIIRPYCLSHKSKNHDPWSLMDVDEGDGEHDERKNKKREPADTLSPPDLDLDQEPPLLSDDVTAFALKARVVYPINQRYRPLADGASNPSLHDSASSDWSSQTEEEDESSESVSSGSAHKAHLNLTFRRASHYAHTLCYTECESRLSMLCVTLENLHEHAAQLQQDKLEIFLQIVRVLFNSDAQLIQQQEKETEQLKSAASPELLGSTQGAELNSHTCTIQEVENTGQERLEHTLHTALHFAKQLEHLCQHSCRGGSSVISQDVTRTLVHCLLLVERQLTDIQANITQTLYDRLQWWEELSGWLRLKTSLFRQEAELIVKLTSQSVEELTADGQLEFDQMEKLITDLQRGITDHLQDLTLQITQNTLQVISEHCQKRNVRMRKMMKNQNKEKSHMTQSHDQQSAYQIATVWAELQVKQWGEREDLELQQDRRLSDSVCDVWKKLFADFSERVTAFWRECVLSMLTTSFTLSKQKCHALLNNIDLTLSSQMQQEENHTHQQLHKLTEQLQQERQIWTEQEALATNAINHLGNQNMKVTMGTVAGQQDLRNSAEGIENKQRLLVTELQRCLTAQHFYYTLLREMKITQLTHTHTQSLQQELLSDLEAASELLRSHAQVLISHALAHRTRLRLVTTALYDTPAADDGQKEQWMLRIRESVSQEFLSTLINNYYTHLQTVVTATQLRPLRQHKELTDRWSVRAECVKALQKELNLWARKPQSVQFCRRVEEQKRRFFTHSEEECGGEMVDLQHLIHTITEELQKEEKSFMSRLVSLTGVPVINTNASKDADHTQLHT
ncbi:evC complex member EVC [Trichomycterus rosablanca]|uniref:evC complex member EVC n=1 Tax=Trichomycterus rosablanca TaxID=2290929 RepID=UPI002F351F47